MFRRVMAPFALLTALAVGGSAGTYVVRPGDTLSGIAARLGVAVGSLAQANGITDPNRVYAGQSLAVPGTVDAAPATVAAGAPRTHVVRPGETLTAIAARFGTTVKAIVLANDIRDPNHVRIGTTLRVPSSPAAPASSGLPARLVASPERMALIPVFEQWAAANGIPADLVMAVAWQESGWQNSVVSHAEAIGIGQLLPSTAVFVARDLIGVPSLDPHVPEDNIRMTARYLRWLLARSGNDVNLALAGYYQGPASVASIGLYQDTKDYLAIVAALRPLFRNR